MNHNNVKKVLTVGFLCLLSLSLGFINLTKTDLHFDEGASWSIVATVTADKIALGQYSSEGNVPGFYLLAKIFPVTHNILLLRIIPALFGAGSIILLYVLLLQNTRSRRIAITGSILLALLPAHIFYSREFRAYIPGLFFQLGSIYLFYKSFRTGTSSTCIKFLWAITTMVALSMTFSSFYILIFFCVWTCVFGKHHLSKNTQLKIYGILAFIFFVSFYWVYSFAASSYGKEAFTMYVAHNNRNIFGSTYDTFHDIILFFPYWLTEANIKTVWLDLASVTILTYMSLVTFLRKGIKNQNNVEMAMLFAACIIPGILFSIFAFDVMSIKLQLLVLVPIVYWISMAFVSMLDGRSTFLHTCMLCILLVLIGLSGIRVVRMRSFAVQKSLQTLAQNIDTNGCVDVVVSHAVAAEVLRFYNYIFLNNMKGKAYIFPMQYSNSVSLKNDLNVLEGHVTSVPCPQLIVVRYYDYWQSRDAGTYKMFSGLLSNYTLQQSFGSTAHPELFSIQRYILNRGEKTRI